MVNVRVQHVPTPVQVTERKGWLQTVQGIMRQTEKAVLTKFESQRSEFLLFQSWGDFCSHLSKMASKTDFSECSLIYLANKWQLCAGGIRHPEANRLH